MPFYYALKTQKGIQPNYLPCDSKGEKEKIQRENEVKNGEFLKIKLKMKRGFGSQKGPHPLFKSQSLPFFSHENNQPPPSKFAPNWFLCNVATS